MEIKGRREKLTVVFYSELMQKAKNFTSTLYFLFCIYGRKKQFIAVEVVQQHITKLCCMAGRVKLKRQNTFQEEFLFQNSFSTPCFHRNIPNPLCIAWGEFDYPEREPPKCTSKHLPRSKVPFRAICPKFRVHANPAAIWGWARQHFPTQQLETHFFQPQKLLFEDPLKIPFHSRHGGLIPLWKNY